MDRVMDRVMGESCQLCGLEYDEVWWAPTDVFDKVRDEFTLLCPVCFEFLARTKGIRLCWVPYERDVADEAVEFDTAAAFAAWRNRSKEISG